MRFLLAAVGLAAAVSSGSGVQTLYTSPNGPIAAFAQDDSVLAWVAKSGSHRCNAVHLLSLKGVNVTLPKPGTDNVTCRWDVAAGPVRLAVAAGTKANAVLWTLHQKAQVSLDYVIGATPQQPLERRFRQVAHTNTGAGLWLSGIAGSGETLVYGTTDIAYVDQLACLSGGTCAMKVAGGAIRRIVGRTDPAVPNTGPSVDVAVAAGRVAYIPAVGIGRTGPVAGPGEPVDVRDGATGALLQTVTPDGTAEGLALSAHVLAVLALSTGGKTVLSWYDPETGRLLGAVQIPPQTSTQLAANDSLVIFRVGRSIRGVDVATGNVRKLATAGSTPIGLSVVGQRLAWAENVKGVGRIRALQLP